MASQHQRKFGRIGKAAFTNCLAKVSTRAALSACMKAEFRKAGVGKRRKARKARRRRRR